MTAVNQTGNALTGATGTGNFVGASNPTFVTDIIVNTITVGLGKNSVSRNTAIGLNALSSNSLSGNANTSVGANSLLVCTTGSSHVFVGDDAGRKLTVGTNNVGVGQSALTNAVDNSSCVAIGYSSLGLATTGNNNTAVGLSSGGALTLGSDNTMLGYSTATNSATSSASLTTGTTNTIVGFQASTNDAATIGSIALGANAVSTIATGATSGDNGPGIAIGSASFPVGFRGDGTIYPGVITSGGYWRTKINGTQYMLPMFPDGASGNLLVSGGALTASSLTFSPTTGGIVGTTTNDNVTALDVGEFVSSVKTSGAPTSLTTATNVDITSISLTAGDWDVWGNVSYIPGAGTTAVSLISWISATSATVPDASLYSATLVGGAALSINVGFTVPSLRFSLSGTTTIYMSTVAVFAVNTLGAAGGLYARRRR